MNVLKRLLPNSMRSTKSPETAKEGLTESHDEVVKTELGLAILQALDNRDVIDEVKRKQKRWDDLHFAHEESRVRSQGVEIPELPKNDMGHTVRIDSADERHFHHGAGFMQGVLPWILAGAVGASALTYYYLTRPETPPVVDVDTDTRSTLRPYTGSLAEPASSR